MTDIKKFPNTDTKPITILSIGHPEREQRTIENIIPPLIRGDVLSQANVAYWLISVGQDDDGVYNMNRAFNDAMRECQSPIIVFTSGDAVITPQLLWRAYGVHLETWRPVITMRVDETGEGSGEGVANNHAIGDFMLMPRKWAVECGGWDERMLSWGFADYALCMRLEALNHPPVVLGERMQDRAIHLWHPRRAEGDEWYREQNRINQRIYRDGPTWTQDDFMAGRERVEEALVCAE